MRKVTGFRLGRVAGIEIQVDWSLLIIFLLVAFSLAAGVFPAWHPDWSPGLAWGTAIAAAILFFASVLIHELSHAIVGRANGIRIRRITLFIFGGMAHMENEAPTWRAELAMAIVGPVTSLVLGAICIWLASQITGPIEIDPEHPAKTLAALNPVATLLLWLGPINMILGIFNLIPGFPLDGGRVLRSVLWAVTGSLHTATQWASRAGQGFAWLLMGTGFAMILGLRVPFFGTGLVSGLWLAFIGWFLNNAAMMGYRQEVIRENLVGLPVTRLMQRQFTRVDPGLAIDDLVSDHVMASGQRAFPVERNGVLAGLISLKDLQKVARAQWSTATVGDLMTPAQSLVTVGADRDANEALALLGRNDLNQLPVVDGDRLVGMVRREDILKWLSLQTGLGTGEAP